MNTPLQKAAQAMIDRWDTPGWRDVPPTSKHIGALRIALANELAQQAATPVPELLELLEQALACTSCELWSPSLTSEIESAIEKVKGEQA